MNFLDGPPSVDEFECIHMRRLLHINHYPRVYGNRLAG
jgi:hypothetical protein